jgi:hypothetical protein
MDALSRRRVALVDNIRKLGFPGLDPAMSDLAFAELEDAVNRVLDMHRSILKRVEIFQVTDHTLHFSRNFS